MCFVHGECLSSETKTRSSLSGTHGGRESSVSWLLEKQFYRFHDKNYCRIWWSQQSIFNGSPFFLLSLALLLPLLPPSSSSSFLVSMQLKMRISQSLPYRIDGSWRDFCSKTGTECAFGLLSNDVRKPSVPCCVVPDKCFFFFNYQEGTLAFAFYTYELVRCEGDNFCKGAVRLMKCSHTLCGWLRQGCREEWCTTLALSESAREETHDWIQYWKRLCPLVVLTSALSYLLKNLP